MRKKTGNTLEKAVRNISNGQSFIQSFFDYRDIFTGRQWGALMSMENSLNVISFLEIITLRAYTAFTEWYTKMIHR